ncbi:lysozyme C II-like [Eucyclogobius newberryi]|uniref:lysozyme C II-like n=1 Tax=Eucyclogobius newberryi TaxID=166745 RepID=UPI003B5923DC
MKLQSLVLLVLLCAVAQGKVFDRCEWARCLKKHGMDGVGGGTLADWVCLTEHVSGYDTKAKNPGVWEGSTDYGIFQINSRYFCRDDGPHAVNTCGVRCSAVLCPKAAIECAKEVAIYIGLNAWQPWSTHCHGKDLSSYTAGCGV